MSAHADFRMVTEVPGARATEEQLSMLSTRYRWAAEHCAGREVLEVACGAGMGLGVLRAHARSAVGGDYSEELLITAAARSAGTPLARLDAQRLPFRPGSFDVVLLLEAIYYLPDPLAFLVEARRVLRERGRLLICTANREWPGFNPSPFSHLYPSSGDLKSMLGQAGFEAVVFGAFPTDEGSSRDRALLLARRAAVRLHLIPSTMRGKALLKRVVFGRLHEIPAVLPQDVEEARLVPIDRVEATSRFKVLYAVGHVMRDGKERGEHE